MLLSAVTVTKAIEVAHLVGCVATTILQQAMPGNQRGGGGGGGVETLRRTTVGDAPTMLTSDTMSMLEMSMFIPTATGAPVGGEDALTPSILPTVAIHQNPVTRAQVPSLRLHHLN